MGALINLTGERGCIDLGVPIHATVEKVIQSYRRRRHRTTVQVQIEQEILRLRAIGPSQQDDMVLWKRENEVFQQGFESSQTWNMIRARSPHVSWSKGLWFREATPKFSFLTWLAAHNRLATGDRILQWNPQAISTCWLCNAATETRDHLFFDCSFAKEVWLGTIRGLAGGGVPTQWLILLQRLVTGLQDSTKTFLFRYSFQATAHALWHERNKRRVGESHQPPGRLINHLDKLIRNKISSLRQQAGSRHEKAMEIWFGSR